MATAPPIIPGTLAGITPGIVPTTILIIGTGMIPGSPPSRHGIMAGTGLTGITHGTVRRCGDGIIGDITIGDTITHGITVAGIMAEADTAEIVLTMDMTVLASQVVVQDWQPTATVVTACQRPRQAATASPLVATMVTTVQAMVARQPLAAVVAWLLAALEATCVPAAIAA